MLEDLITKDVTLAMKSGDKERLSILRMAMSAMKN